MGQPHRWRRTLNSPENSFRGLSKKFPETLNRQHESAAIDATASGVDGEQSSLRWTYGDCAAYSLNPAPATRGEDARESRRNFAVSWHTICKISATSRTGSWRICEKTDSVSLLSRHPGNRSRHDLRAARCMRKPHRRPRPTRPNLHRRRIHRLRNSQHLRQRPTLLLPRRRPMPRRLPLRRRRRTQSLILPRLRTRLIPRAPLRPRPSPARLRSRATSMY